jgi:NADH-quinone oxidoreductase subunit L
MALSVVVALVGICLAYRYYLSRPELAREFVRKHKGIYKLVHNKYFVDEIYGLLFVNGLLRLGRFLKVRIDEGLVDRIVNGIGLLFRWLGSIIRVLQSGYVQNYAFGMILGAIVVLGYLIIKIIG